MVRLEWIKEIRHMWLPTPVYKALPTAYAVIGVAFIAGTLYVGPDAPLGVWYLGIGIVSILASITVSVWRAKHKQNRAKVDTDETPAA